ncbi:C40 family peptidase [Clostridium sp. Marseille-P2415]|uniref:C40 family peptidase n=1 Tax=Clostridium sp. Marseille-P2415 TaxID=1805471 RepID=UPI0009883386|nr:C40 family peptidase [Clostridium sp. Marseille-P2415]
MTDKAWKVLGFAIACGSAVWIGTADVQAARSENSPKTGSPVAGIEVYMDQYQESIKRESTEASAGLTQEKVRYGTFNSIFKNLGVATVEDSLNIRKEPKNDAEIVGKLRSHAGCSVLSEKNGWYKIKSGQVTGYVSGKYLATGQEARAIAYYDMKLMLRVNTETLRVRSQPNTDSEILDRIHEGETYRFISYKSGWAKFDYKGQTAYAYAPENAAIAYTIPEAEKIGDLRSQVVNYAVGFVGNPYRWGGTNPNTGADCSGFIQYVMEHAAGVHLDRTSRQQAEEGQAVTASGMEPGDLLFYASGREIDHVAMYIGKGKIVHAANRRSGIKISSWNYRKPVTIRSVIP